MNPEDLEKEELDYLNSQIRPLEEKLNELRAKRGTINRRILAVKVRQALGKVYCHKDGDSIRYTIPVAEQDDIWAIYVRLSTIHKEPDNFYISGDALFEGPLTEDRESSYHQLQQDIVRHSKALWTVLTNILLEVHQ
jgi:hypothetical protein